MRRRSSDSTPPGRSPRATTSAAYFSEPGRTDPQAGAGDDMRADLDAVFDLLESGLPHRMVG